MNSSKAISAKLSAYLPNPDDFMDLQTYNKLYSNMIKNQTDEKGNDLPQKEQLEEQHKGLRTSMIKMKIADMKNQRKKK